jgi:hypothetical protein
VSRGVAFGLEDGAVGLVIGEAMRPEEDGDGAVGILVNSDHGLDEVRPQAARRQLETESVPFDGIVVADGALFLDAQDVRPCHRAIEQKARAFLLGRHREGGVVRGDVGLGEPSIGRFDGADPSQRELLGQPVLQGTEGALRAAAGPYPELCMGLLLSRAECGFRAFSVSEFR